MGVLLLFSVEKVKKKKKKASTLFLYIYAVVYLVNKYDTL